MYVTVSPVTTLPPPLSVSLLASPSHAASAGLVALRGLCRPPAGVFRELKFEKYAS